MHEKDKAFLQEKGFNGGAFFFIPLSYFLTGVRKRQCGYRQLHIHPRKWPTNCQKPCPLSNLTNQEQRTVTFSALPQTVQKEIVQLSQRYGQPLERLVTLPTKKLFDPLNKRDRYGEVCMVIRRKNGRLLTMIKTYYPKKAYRLLTGGIDHGEPIFDALLRETAEETGLDVEVNRFLVAAAYRLTGEEVPRFYTFAFLLEEIGGTLGIIDEGEQVEDFREIELHELPAMANHLKQVGDNGYSKKIGGKWRDWGHFRATIHTLVHETMTSI